MTASRTPSLAEVIRRAIEAQLADVRVSLPARVERYDATKQLVDVQPLLRMPREDGDALALPVITNVPLQFQGAGDFFITFPVAAGDVVLLVFTDWSLDRWKDDPTKTDPVDLGAHTLAGAVAIPGLRSPADALSGVSSSVMRLGKVDGAKVEIGDEVVLDGGSDAVAREGDTVEVTIGIGEILVPIVSAPFFAPNPAPITLSGEITSGAARVKA